MTEGDDWRKLADDDFDEMDERDDLSTAHGVMSGCALMLAAIAIGFGVLAFIRWMFT